MSLKLISRCFLALQNLGGCLSEFLFVSLLKLVESFALIIYVRSDLAYFEGKLNENSPRQPLRFCNTKNLLLLLFKMLYSKAKSSQKRSFKLRMKSGDPIPVFYRKCRDLVSELVGCLGEFSFDLPSIDRT